MDKTWIKNIKQTRRFKLSLREETIYYSLPVIMTIGSCLLLYIIHQADDPEGNMGIKFSSNFVRIAPAFLILSLVLYFNKFGKLWLKKIEISLSGPEFEEVLQRMIGDYGWQIKIRESGFVLAHKKRPGQSSSYETIIVVKQKDHLLVHSISKPSFLELPATGKRNKMNIDALLKTINKVHKGAPVSLTGKFQSGSMHVGAWIFRIVAYIIGLASLRLAIFLISSSGWQSALVGWIIVTFLIYCAQTDYHLITANRQSRKLNRD